MYDKFAPPNPLAAENDSLRRRIAMLERDLILAGKVRSVVLDHYAEEVRRLNARAMTPALAPAPDLRGEFASLRLRMDTVLVEVEELRRVLLRPSVG